MTSFIPILVAGFNAAVEIEPSVATIIDAIRNHPTTSAAVKAQLDDIAVKIAADETEADNLPPLPDAPVPTAS